MKITFIDELLKNEWIITNGIGGFASLSVCGANTRKYHGLLVASMSPPTDRQVLVSKVEERVKINGEYHDLSVNQYPDAIYPEGHHFLHNFDRKPLPKWRYSGNNWALDKKVFMIDGANATIVVYTNKGKEVLELEVHPLLVNKDYHATFREDSKFDFYFEKKERAIKVHSHYGSEAYYMASSKGEFNEARGWYKNIQLPREKYRGQNHVEDFYRIGYYTTSLQPGEQVSFVFATDEKSLSVDVSKAEKAVLRKIKSVQDKTIKDTFYNDLLVAGDQFVVKRHSTNSDTILAGYHWFADWGRDTMIAMRGLTIARGRKIESKSILSTFLKYLDRGMLPNKFPDYEGEEIEYNTIDATLWLFVAMYDYYQKFEDKAFIKKYLNHLKGVLDAHIEGTRYNIHVTDEGLLYGGQEGVQLTWMDAITDGKVWTPRIGCPVEINALWYNALCIYDYFVDEIQPKRKGDYSQYKSLLKENFKKYFLNEDGYLNDVVIPGQQPDASFKSNQLYALSLPFRLLTQSEERKILKQVKKKLLTPYGIRTLAMDDSNFVPVYEGNQATRDNSYHQGVVWPFIISEYYEPFLRLNKNSLKARTQVKKELEALKEHFYNADCLYGISEIFDGAAPKEGRGTIHQAWSISALVKLYTDYKLYEIE